MATTGVLLTPCFACSRLFSIQKLVQVQETFFLLFFFGVSLSFPSYTRYMYNTFVRALYAYVCIRLRRSLRQRFDLSLLVVDRVSLLTRHTRPSLLSPVPSDCGHHASRDGTCMTVQQHHSSRYCCCGRHQTKRVASRRRNE